jgi:hypothetical protein
MRASEASPLVLLVSGQIENSITRTGICQQRFKGRLAALLAVSLLALASSALAQGTSTPTATATVTPSPSPAQALNVSTRLQVETGDRVMIGGFIVTSGPGGALKKVAIRGIGPSLGSFGLSDLLADPTLQLRGSDGALLMQNDNWQDNLAQAAELISLGLALQDPRESGIVATLQPGSYTALMAGKNLTSGIGLVEIYDADTAAPARLANTSTRGFVRTGDNVMIGGFILGHGSASSAVAVRGIGPSLSQFGLSNVLADPTLELRDSNGTLLIANDNWQDHPTQAAQLTAHGLAPQNALESGIFIILPPGAFTAILTGKDGSVGLGLVEVYSGLQAATLTATSTADSGAGSLRDTIAAAIDGDTIQFAAALSGQAIVLTSAEIAIDKNITISGPGPSQLTVQRSKVIGTPFFRIFHVMPDRTVTIEGLTISDGLAESGAGILTDHATLTINNCSVENNYASEQGGGIFNDGGSNTTVTIVNSFVTSNGAFGSGLSIRGGGIHNKSGALEILNSRVDGNAVASGGGSACGGGIYNDTGTLKIVDSLVRDNFAFPGEPDPHHHSSGSGIGIYNDINGTLAIRNSAVSGNNTQAFPFTGYGGGIYNTGTAQITDSMISGNFPSIDGGGIYNTGAAEITDSTVRQNSTRNSAGGIYNGGTLTITNSTLSDNTAVNKLLGYGGGLVNGGPLMIINSTLSGNHADGEGGGIHNNGPLTITHSTLSYNFSYPNGLNSGGNIRNVGDGALRIGNTILHAGSPDSIFRNSANVISHGYNLCSDDGGGFLNSSGDQINTDPILGPLQKNGGPTFTHRLLTGSPAIDAGDPNFTPPPLYDQRGPGYDRVYNGRIDIGSFELRPAPPTPGRR